MLEQENSGRMHIFKSLLPVLKRFGNSAGKKKQWTGWLGLWHNSLEFAALGTEFKVLQQFQTIFVGL